MEAASVEQLAWCICGSVIAGSALAFAVSFLTVHRTADAVHLANRARASAAVSCASSIFGRGSPPGRLHILHGNGRVRRSAALLLEGGQPVRWLRGG